MIIIIISLLTLATFFSFMFIKNGLVRWILGSISLILLVGSIFLLTIHIDSKWGMKEVTMTSSHQIYTAGESSQAFGMMIKAEIGQNTDNYVLIYRNDKDSKKPDTNFEPDQKHLTEAIKKTASYKLVDGDKATVTTTSTRRVFTNKTMKFLFGLGGERNELVKEKSVVSVPRETWLVLTQDQVKKLPEIAAQMTAQAKANPQTLPKNPTDMAKLQVKELKTALGVSE